MVQGCSLKVHIQMAEKLLAFMEPKTPLDLSYSQEPATGHNRESDGSSPHSKFSKISFSVFVSFTLTSHKWSLPRALSTKICVCMPPFFSFPCVPPPLSSSLVSLITVVNL